MHRLPRFFLCSMIAFLPAAGMLFGTGTGIIAGSAANASTTPPAQAVAMARNAIKQLTVGDHATDQSAGRAWNINGLTQVQSTNWSGYADTGSNFSSVTGSWTEPSPARCGFTESLAAFWVGIDGYNSSSVEQDGTLIECFLGTAYQFTWWEMYPTNSIQTVGSSLAAGDHITASVVRAGANYTLSVTDSTHPANSFTTVQACATCANTSAEWIAEAPSSTTGVLPLANFGTWTESGATVNENGTNGVISSFTDDEITMIDSSNQVKAQPGALNSGGNGFSVAWQRAS